MITIRSATMQPQWRLLLLAAGACAVSGCALAPPQPWEKDLLARPSMAMDDDPLGRRLRTQVHQSREASSGGDSVGGGGCGCN